MNQSSLNLKNLTEINFTNDELSDDSSVVEGGVK